MFPWPVGCLHDLHRFTHTPTATKAGLSHPFIFHTCFYLAPFLPPFPWSPIPQSPPLPPYFEQCSLSCLFSAPAAGAEGWQWVRAAPASPQLWTGRSWQPKTPSSRSTRDAKRQRAGGQLLLEGSTDKGKQSKRWGKNKHKCPLEGIDQSRSLWHFNWRLWKHFQSRQQLAVEGGNAPMRKKPFLNSVKRKVLLNIFVSYWFGDGGLKVN